MLSGGDRRSLGLANRAAMLAQSDPAIFARLVDGMSLADPVVVMRCADAVEKASAARPDMRALHKAQIVRLLATATQAELRWHIAMMVARLPLTPAESRNAFDCLLDYTADRSSIVKSSAMQALCDLALKNARLRQAALLHIGERTLTGTPAMKARGKKLLQSLNRSVSDRQIAGGARQGK